MTMQGLRWMDPEQDSYLQSTTRVRAVNAVDFEGWEAALTDPANSPVPHMRKQNQPRNDCQGNATANGEEKRRWYCTGKMLQLSDTYAYNACEYLEGAVGRDQGTNMQSGVRLLVDGLKPLDVAPGLPAFDVWNYSRYYRKKTDFIAAAQSATIEAEFVSEHGPMPDWEGILIGVAAGGTGHIGTFWPPRWTSVGGVRCMDTAPTGGGGHATEIIWAHQINGKWYLVVWNSHGDGFYLMSQRCYETLQRTQFRPFGGYLLMPDKPIERFHDRRRSGGGYY